MSRFRVLKIDHFDPVEFGKRNRRIFTIYYIVIAVIMILLNIHFISIHKPHIIQSILFPLALLISLPLIWRLKRIIKRIKTIGDIEFTTSGIKKRIGDSLVEYNYQMIKEIEIQKHIPATSLKESKTGYFSYILKIIFRDSGSESIVVADRSIDSKQRLSIIETLKALKRISPCEIKLP